MDTAALKVSPGRSWPSAAMSRCTFYSHLLLEEPCAALDVSIQMLAQRDKLVAALCPVVSKRRRARQRGAPPQQLGRYHRRFSV
jgi:hypothetical protein